jgi:hypothetical protein
VLLDESPCPGEHGGRGVRIAHRRVGAHLKHPDHSKIR